MDFKAFLDGFQKLMEDTITSRNQATLAAFNNSDEELLKHTHITKGVVACLSTFKIEREKFEKMENDVAHSSITEPGISDGVILD